MTELTCERFEELDAELALGVLEGRDRADALAHLEGCPRCRARLDQLTPVADGLAQLAPSAEPPAGFETRVLARLQDRVRAPRPRLGRWAVAAALALAVGVGGWALGHGLDTARSGRASAAAVGTLLAGHQDVGQVLAVGGRHPSVSVTVDDGGSDQPVRCDLIETDRTVVPVGTFWLSGGYGAWKSGTRVDPSAIFQIRLLDPSGATVAAATMHPVASSSG